MRGRSTLYSKPLAQARTHLSLISIGAPLSLAVNRILCSLRLIFQNTLTVGARHTLMHRCAPNSIMRGAQTAPCQSAAQASIAIAAANGALGREVQNARRSRTDRMENKPKNNKVWNVKKASVLQVKWLALDFPARGSGAGRGCSG